jgi:hypothetical protein
LLQTDPFIANTGLLRVRWHARGTGGTFTIVLHSDVSGRSLTPVVEHTGPGSGEKYISEDPRSFFLVIDGKDLEWSVEVAEGHAATSSQARVHARAPAKPKADRRQRSVLADRNAHMARTQGPTSRHSESDTAGMLAGGTRSSIAWSSRSPRRSSGS